MSESRTPLDLERVMTLVADAAGSVLLGLPTQDAARALIDRRRPSALELAAAGRENHEVHRGQDHPILLAAGLPPVAVPDDVVRLERAVADVLAAAHVLVAI